MVSAIVVIRTADVSLQLQGLEKSGWKSGWKSGLNGLQICKSVKCHQNVTQMFSIQDDFAAKRRNACIAGPYFSSFWKGLLSANAASEYSLKLQNALNNIDRIR